MADAGLNAVEKALYAKLAAASAVTALVPAARHYSTVIPSSGTYPAITIAYLESGTQGRAFEGDAEEYDYLVRGWTSGDYSLGAAGDIAEAIDAALHRATLSPTGYAGGVYAIQRQRWVRGIETDDARTPFPFAGAVYRLWAQRS